MGRRGPPLVSFQPDGLRFLKLRVLSLQTLEGFRTVYLDQVTVPSLQDLTLQHKSRSCWVHLDLPQIRSRYAIAARRVRDLARSLRHRRDRVDGVNAPLHSHGVGPRRNLYLRSWEGEADCVRSLLAEAVDLETFAAVFAGRGFEVLLGLSTGGDGQPLRSLADADLRCALFNEFARGPLLQPR